MSTTYLTTAGFEKLEHELAFLRTTKRREIAELLHNTIEGEDIGPEQEASYESVKNLQSFVEGRICELERILANVRIIHRPVSQDLVELGSTVTILDSCTREEETYTIVGAAEANPREGTISDQSPIGKALLGCRLHDEINVQTPSGCLVARIIKID
jgi:transcription elongation factor GreA